MRGLLSIFLGLSVSLVACKDERPAPAGTGSERGASTRKLAGVYPEDWKCESVAPLDALAAVLGGPVRALDSAISVTKGLPHPCNYQLEGKDVFWTFDIDCRDGMKQRADALFAQYRQTSHDLVQQYDTLADAGAIKPSDAGVPVQPPEEAIDVAVGAKALDHHGRGLLFIDDDAPCYVRVVGKDAARRLELAKLVARNLTFANAPMTPRPQP